MAAAREKLGAVWSGRRRWWLASGLALLTVLAAGAAVSWHFSAAVLVPDHSSHAPMVRVEAISPGRIALARDADSEQPGVYGLEWPGGHAVVGAVVGQSDDTVTRQLRDVRGYLVPEMEVGIESDVFVGNPRQALGLPYRRVAVPDELGPMPAWLLPVDQRRGVRGAAARPATWAIFVHGINGSRQNGLRLAPTLHRAGLPTLLISYREDQGAPASPDGFHHMGQTEWLDLEAAARYALAHGAHRLVFVGASMGGAIVAQFMEKSALADRVASLVLDAPVLDWRATLEFHSTEMGLPGFAAMPVEWAVGARIDADWDSLDAVAHPASFQLPILLFHGTDDEVVPIATSNAFAAELPARVTYYRVPRAGHVQSWNVDPALYDQRLTSFLDSR